MNPETNSRAQSLSAARRPLLEVKTKKLSRPRSLEAAGPWHPRPRREPDQAGVAVCGGFLVFLRLRVCVGGFRVWESGTFEAWGFTKFHRLFGAESHVLL